MSQPSLPRHPDKLNQCITELSERVIVMEKRLTSSEEGRLQLVTMISNLQHQVRELKGKLPEP